MTYNVYYFYISEGVKDFILSPLYRKFEFLNKLCFVRKQISENYHKFSNWTLFFKF